MLLFLSQALGYEREEIHQTTFLSEKSCLAKRNDTAAGLPGLVWFVDRVGERAIQIVCIVYNICLAI